MLKVILNTTFPSIKKTISILFIIKIIRHFGKLARLFYFHQMSLRKKIKCASILVHIDK